MTTNPRSIPDRSSPGSTRTAPPAAHQGLSSEKCATDGKSRIRARDKTVIGTWNVRTLRTAGRIEQLEHEMTRYNWQVLGLCEVRMKQFGESRTQEGHKFFFSGREDKHQEGIGFLVNKEIVNCVISCQPISSRIMTLRLNATPLNITIIQAYAPTSDYDDDFVDQFYEQIQEVLDKVPKKDYLIVQGDWNAKIGQDAHRDWKGICGACTNAETNERGTRLLEFASSNDLCIANTFGSHKDSRRWTWHHPDREHHSQIDYILVKRRHKSGINVGQTRSFPGADIGSDHDLVMMSFKMRLKRMKKEGNVRMKFDLDKLQDPNIAEVFRAKIGGKFAPLLVLDTDVEELTEKLTSAVTETAQEVLGKPRPTKKPWVTADILEKCDRRREMKSGRNESEEKMKEYRDINRDIKHSMSRAKENWVEGKCRDIEHDLTCNNTKKAYQTVKELSSSKQNRSSVIQDKQGNSLTEGGEILGRW